MTEQALIAFILFFGPLGAVLVCIILAIGDAVIDWRNRK